MPNTLRRIGWKGSKGGARGGLRRRAPRPGSTSGLHVQAPEGVPGRSFGPRYGRTSDPSRCPPRSRAPRREVSLPSKRARRPHQDPNLGQGPNGHFPASPRGMQIRAPGSSWDLSAEPSDSQFLSRRSGPSAARPLPWRLRAPRAQPPGRDPAPRARSLPRAGPAGPPRRAPRPALESPWSAAAAAPQLAPGAGESQARAPR